MKPEAFVKLENIIKQRLNLGSNQRILNDEFGLDWQLEKLTNKNFLKNDFANWPDKKKNRFIRIIGGPVNFNKTKHFLQHLISH